MSAKVHEGKELEKWLIGKRWSAEDLGRELGVSKQTVYYHIGREQIADSFLGKMTAKEHVFLDRQKVNSKQLSEPEETYVSDMKTDPTMNNELSYLRQRVKDLEEINRLKDELLSVYRTQTPGQVEIVQGSKRAAS